MILTRHAERQLNSSIDILFDRFSGLEQIMFCFKSARQKSNPLA